MTEKLSLIKIIDDDWKNKEKIKFNTNNWGGRRALSSIKLAKARYFN